MATKVKKVVTESENNPMMKQFRALKEKHPNAVVLFRCGDFYEAYCEDAKICADILGITLTKRDDIDMAGFPYHALDKYLPKLISKGQRIAICDQLEAPKTTPKTKPTMRLNINANNESKNVAAAAPQVANPVVEDAIAEEIKETPKAKDDGVVVKQVDVVGLMGALKKNGKAKLSDHATTVVSLGNDLPTVTFSTYTTKRGDTAPQIIGFGGEDDPRWKRHREMQSKYVSAGYRRDLNGNKVYVLLFGTRYMEVAKSLTEVYNTSDKAEWECVEAVGQATYEQAQAEGKARYEAMKAERAEKRAAKSGTTAQPVGKVYTAKDVENVLREAFGALATALKTPVKDFEPIIEAAMKKAA